MIQAGFVTIHILLAGQPFCGFSSEVPGKWPLGHQWVGPEGADKSNCLGCKKNYAEAERSKSHDRQD